MVNYYGIGSVFDRAGASWSSSVNSYGAGIMPGISSSDGGGSLCGFVTGGTDSLMSTSRQMCQNFSNNIARFGSLAPFMPLTPMANSAFGVAGNAVAGGMALGFPSPVVAAPAVMPTFYPPSAPVGPAASTAGGGTNIDSVGDHEPSQAKDASGTDKSGPVSRDDLKAAKEAGKRKGYNEKEMEKIIGEAKAASENDSGKFNEIISALPAKPNYDEAKNDVDREQKQRDWERRFGQWHAKHIGKIKKAEDTEQVVKDTAGGGTMKLSLKKAEDKKPVPGVQHYTVVEPGDSEIKDVYYKASDRKWFKDDKCTKPIELAGSSNVEPGDTAKISVKGVQSDYLEVMPSGTHEAPAANNNGNKNIGDRFKVDGSRGELSKKLMDDIQPADDGQRYIFYDSANGCWVYKSKAKAKEKNPYLPIENVEYRSGRLYFKKGDDILDTAHADDVVGYMGTMGKAEAGFKDRQDKVTKAEAAQREEREKKVEAQFREWLGDKKDDVKFSYDAEKNVLTITCTADKARRDAVLSKLGVEDNNKDKDKNTKKGQDLMAQLPKDCKVRFVDEGAKPETGRDISSDPFNGMVTELKKAPAATAAETKSGASSAQPAAMPDDNSPQAKDRYKDAVSKLNKANEEAQKARAYLYDDQYASIPIETKQARLRTQIDALKAEIAKQEAVLKQYSDGHLQKLIEIYKDKVAELEKSAAPPAAKATA